MNPRTLLTLGVAVLGACSSTVEVEVTGRVPERATLEEGMVEILRSARERMEAGDALGANDRYSSLAATHPGDPWLAALAQEARYEVLGLDSEELAVNLRRSYREAAESQPSPLGFMLAARAEPDAYAALNLADLALALDPEFAWGHYARAHALSRLGDTEAARIAVERAVSIDAGHLPAWWLLAWLRSHAGEQDVAIATWTAWLEVAREDPRVSKEALTTAECDLGVLLIRARRHEEALAILDAAESDSSGRSSSVLAAAVVEAGEVEAALANVRAARERDPDALLYVVQEALLLERRAPKSREAIAAWQDVYDRTEGVTNLSALLQRTRAEAHLSTFESESSSEAASAQAAD